LGVSKPAVGISTNATINWQWKCNAGGLAEATVAMQQDTKEATARQQWVGIVAMSGGSNRNIKVQNHSKSAIYRWC